MSDSRKNVEEQTDIALQDAREGMYVMEKTKYLTKERLALDPKEIGHGMSHKNLKFYVINTCLVRTERYLNLKYI